MYSQQELECAVRDGVLSDEEAGELRSFLERRRGASHIDDEDVPLVGGMDDVFSAIAALLTLVAVGWIVGSLVTVFAGLAVAAAAWLLALHFTAKKKLALTSRLLVGAFIFGLFLTGSLFGGVTGKVGRGEEARLFSGALFALAGGWFHWRRFRVPVTIASTSLCGVILLVALANSTFGTHGYSSRPALGAMLVGGIWIFIWAMKWDSSDRLRITRRADIAFWLHVTAATLIVHPIFWLTGLARGSGTPVGGVLVIIVYLALGLVSLAIDRRALLLSALVYVLWALGNLLSKSSSLATTIPATALVIGSGLLLLSAFWKQARRAVVSILPIELRDRLLPAARRETSQPAA